MLIKENKSLLSQAWIHQEKQQSQDIWAVQQGPPEQVASWLWALVSHLENEKTKLEFLGPFTEVTQQSSERNYRDRSQSGGCDQPLPDSPFPPLSSPHFQGHSMLSSAPCIGKTSRSAPAICQLLIQNQGTK